MKKILVTTDFSDISKAAIRFAIQLADQTPCELIFYHAHSKSILKTLTHQETDEHEIDVLENKLKKFVLSIYKATKKLPGHIEFIIDKQEHPDVAIINYAKKCQADFICINTSGPGIFNQLIGTTASKLITTSPIPLLVIPYSYHRTPIHLLLYATDIKKMGMELQLVKEFATLFDAEIAVYHYNELLEKGNYKNDLEKTAQNYQSDKVHFHFKKLNIEYSLLDHLQIDIRQSRPSMLVMFTKQNRDWFERHFLSSKTKEFGYDANTPILVFRK